MDGDNIGVFKQPQETQLADDPDGVCFVSQHAVDVLDGDLFVGLAILCRTVDTHAARGAGEDDCIPDGVSRLADLAGHGCC